MGKRPAHNQDKENTLSELMTLKARPVVVGRVLRQLREERGMSLKDVSAKVGMPFNTLASKERGVNAWKIPEIVELATLYGVGVTGLMAMVAKQTGVEVVKTDPIPIANASALGHPIDYRTATLPSPWDAPWARVDRDAATQHAGVFGVVVIDDTLAPDIRAGDTLMLREVGEWEHAIGDIGGKVCWVSFGPKHPTMGGRHWLATITRGKGGAVELRGRHPGVPVTIVQEQDIAAVAVAVQLRRPL